MSRSNQNHFGFGNEGHQEKVLLVGVQLPDQDSDSIEESLAELSRLVQTLGGKVMDTIIQRRPKVDPRMYIGSGKAEEIGKRAKDLACTLIVFDSELTGGQQNHLEKAMDCRVIDRTGVILDIFSRHARTKEAKNQVELASLEYLATHLTRRWTHLDRERGGGGGGGIGPLRGAGEKQIELDRRQIRRRISRLREKITHFARDRETQRGHRDRFLRVALVGYTNAGKSTLMNALTHSEVYVDDRLFATLDSTVRVIDPKTRPPVLLSDTVGFIDKLPHNLVASFRSTLQEVIEADLLLHVVDLSAPNYMDQLDVTCKVLDEIGVGAKPSILVFNKADLVDEYFLPRILERKYLHSTVVSSFREEDMKRLRDSILGYFEQDMIEMELVIPYDNSYLQSQIHAYSKVLEKKYVPEGAHFKIRIMRADASRLKLPKAGVQP